MRCIEYRMFEHCICLTIAFDFDLFSLMHCHSVNVAVDRVPALLR